MLRTLRPKRPPVRAVAPPRRAGGTAFAPRPPNREPVHARRPEGSSQGAGWGSSGGALGELSWVGRGERERLRDRLDHPPGPDERVQRKTERRPGQGAVPRAAEPSP